MFVSSFSPCTDRHTAAQVTLAVLVSGWAHVLHATYKPWRASHVMYLLQHASLFITSFVFLMVRHQVDYPDAIETREVRSMC